MLLFLVITHCSIKSSAYAHPFAIQRDLASKSRELDIYITVSIGVATAPMDGEDSIALIRHADRALYIGAKQAGRNRVAHYENVSQLFSHSKFIRSAKIFLR
ncbi:diguanylate cyclase domain-containing protein [Bacillus chungangensis]|uniref:diguanylate cyclase domain-containing protein n=1 Tax=Bacillus chungangensis TaxID=587633 RepID=UPI0027D84ADC|nr:diguanylate cyclase [Bacillus chungangensis]